jgi:hypothetical protein
MQSQPPTPQQPSLAGFNNSYRKLSAAILMLNAATDYFKPQADDTATFGYLSSASKKYNHAKRTLLDDLRIVRQAAKLFRSQSLNTSLPDQALPMAEQIIEHIISFLNTYKSQLSQKQPPKNTHFNTFNQKFPDLSAAGLAASFNIGDEKIERYFTQKFKQQINQIKPVIQIQNIAKAHLSRKKTKDRTLLDLGAGREIDIKQHSKANLRRLRQQLSPHFQSDSRRAKLLEKLLNKDFTIHHTTAAPLVEKIVAAQDPHIFDQTETMRRGIPLGKTATPPFAGIESNIFFGISGGPKLNQFSLPFFARQRKNLDTEKTEDYTTIRANLRDFINQNPHSGIWSGGHYAHYEQAGYTEPMPPTQIGSTEFYWEYVLEHPFKDEERRYVKLLNFKRADGTHTQHRIEIGDEVSVDEDLLPFLALSFIQRLGFVGGELEEHILSNPNDDEIINTLYEQLFRVDDFEIHLPTKLKLDETYVTVLSPQKRKAITEEVSAAAREGDITKLGQLVDKGYPLDGYMYHDPYVYDESGATTLPLVEAINARQYVAVQWLIKQGASRSSFLNSATEVVNATHETNITSAQENLLIITALFILGDSIMLKIFDDENIDFNLYQKSQLKSAIEHVNKEKGLVDTILSGDQDKYLDKNIVMSDQVFLALIQAFSQHGNRSTLSTCLLKLSYVTDNCHFKQRLYEDIARVGNEATFTYFQEKHPVNVNYSKLFIIAAKNNNTLIIPFLYRNVRNKSSLNKLIKEFILAKLHGGYIELAECLMTLNDSPPANFTEDEVTAIIYGSKFVATSDEAFKNKTSWMIARRDYVADVKLLQYAISIGAYKTARWLIDEQHLNVDIVHGEENPLASVLTTGDLEFATYLANKNPLLKNDPSLYEDVVKSNQEAAFTWLLENAVALPETINDLVLLARQAALFSQLVLHVPTPTKLMLDSNYISEIQELLNNAMTVEKNFYAVTLPQLIAMNVMPHYIDEVMATLPAYIQIRSSPYSAVNFS